MIKHIFFDLDNTLMLSRTTMSPGDQVVFRQLCDTIDVVVVSGAQHSQIRTQIPAESNAKFYVLAQTGNHALNRDGLDLWKETFTTEQTSVTLGLIEKIKHELNIRVKDPKDLVELRGAQISYSPIGHHEDLDKKYAFDPKTTLRQGVLKMFATDVARLRKHGIDVVPGGTTCFDFFLAGKNKGFNILRLLQLEQWNKEECIYVGDALFPGGNDETVVGVIPTKPVADPTETFLYIKNILKPHES